MTDLLGPKEGETLDELRAAGLRILQGRDGYRFSLDPVLLSAFAQIRDGEGVVDLGTGSGVIPLLLARSAAAERVIGVEVQAGLAERARRNVRLNGLEGRVTILEGDLRQRHEALPPQTFDVVLANPPYRRQGTGRTAPLPERAAARHELAGGLDDFIAAASRLLRGKGRFYIVYLAERLPELLSTMQRFRLAPKRLRAVHSRIGEPARMVLVEGRKDGRAGMEVEAPLYVYEGERYSDEVLAIYGEER